MAFQAGGTDYGGFLRQRARADEGVTRAMERKARADKQARIKKSGQRSGLQQLAAGVARGAAAYYTGGMSEQMGAGEMIDEATLGTDSEGGAVKSKYGGLVKAGSAVYQGSKAQKAGKLGEQDARFDKLMDRRQSNVKMLFEAGDKKGAMKAQSAMEDMRLKYDTNRKDAEGKGWGGSGLGMTDEDYNLQPTAMDTGQRAAKVTRLNKSEADVAREQAIIGDEGRRQQGQTSSMPPTADAPAAPDASLPGQFGGAQPLQQPKSAAIQYDTSGGGSPTILQQQKQEKDDLIERIRGIKPQGGQEEDREMLEKKYGGKRYRDDIDFTDAYGISEQKRKALRLQGYGA